MAKQYFENNEGVHLGGNRSDYTLCGNALEGTIDGHLECVETKKRVVTCFECISIINHCKNVRVNKDRLVCNPVQQNDEMYCATCNCRWDVSDNFTCPK